MQLELEMTSKHSNRFTRSKNRKVFTIIIITAFILISTNLYVRLNLVRKDKVDVHQSLDYNIFLQKEDRIRSGFVVDISKSYRTQICKRPKLSLLNDAIKHAFHKMDPLECRGQNLFYLREGILHMNRSILNQKNVDEGMDKKEFEKSNDLTKQVKIISKCEYLAIERVTDDFPTYTESIVKIAEPFDIIIKHDFIRVQCRLNNSRTDQEAGDKDDEDKAQEDDEYREENVGKMRHLLFSKDGKIVSSKNVKWKYSKYLKTDNKVKINSNKTNFLYEKGKKLRSSKDIKIDKRFLARKIAEYDQSDSVEKGIGDRHFDDFGNYDPADADLGHMDVQPDDDTDFDQFLVQVYPKESVFKRISEILTQKNNYDKNRMNILIIGLDSMSNLAFQRKLPLTYRYIKNILDGVILRGYNIVGDATTAALVPILTGKNETELPEVRKSYGNAGNVNDYPMIWDSFKKKGYVTLFAEDEPSISAFNLRLNGFQNQPTDHYMRPFWQTLWASNLPELSAKYCTGASPNHMFMLDYLKDFFVKYNNVSKFGFGFLSELTHWDNNPGEYLDGDLLNFLKSFQKLGYLDNTLLIVMSDHGARYSKVRFTVQGKMEERLPFMSLVFPRTFRKKYPHLIKNLHKNSDKLTTPFDIHEILQDVLDISRVKNNKPFPNQRGISLFQEIPLNRTCESAHIDLHWCTCLTRRDVSADDHLVKKCVAAVIDQINMWTEPVRNLCVELELRSITSSYLIIPNEKVLKYIKSKDQDNRVANFSKEINLDIVHYQVTIETRPNAAMFEATVMVNLKEGSISVYPDVSRLSSYGNQPACVQKRYPDLRKYCYCKNLLKENGG